MPQTVRIQIGDGTLPFELDFTERRWSAAREVSEGDFPLVTEVDGKRYELYSDGTFAEVER